MDTCGLHEYQEVGGGCGCPGGLLVCCGRVGRDIAFEYRYIAVIQRRHGLPTQILFRNAGVDP